MAELTQDEINLVTNFKELFEAQLLSKKTLIQKWENKKKVNFNGIKNNAKPKIPHFIITQIINELINLIISVEGPDFNLTLEEHRRKIEIFVKNKLFELEVLSQDEDLHFCLNKKIMNDIIG